MVDVESHDVSVGIEVDVQPARDLARLRPG